MTRMIFVNLPVRNVAASTAFYEAVGAVRDPDFCDASTSMVKFSDTIAFMLLSHARFADFTGKTIIDARTHVQMLIALSAENRDAVNDMVANAAAGRWRNPRSQPRSGLRLHVRAQLRGPGRPHHRGRLDGH